MTFTDSVLKNQPIKTDHCPNCGASLDGENFCPQCGQKNDTQRLTLKHVLGESLNNLFAFDGRFFHTLLSLFRSPGKVPKEFIQGKRMRYMNPIRFYFLASLVLLFLMQFTDNSSSMVKLQVEPTADSASTPKIQDIHEILPFVSNSPHYSQMAQFYESHPTIPVINALDSLGMKASLLNRFSYRQVAKISHFDQKAFNDFLFSKLFWVLFLFLPILALLLKILYIRRKFYYPEHLFFTLYSQSVFFILLMFIVPWDNPPSALAFLVFLFFAFYLFIAMKRFYGQGLFKTLLKYILLNLMIVPAFLLFFAMAMAVVFILF